MPLCSNVAVFLTYWNLYLLLIRFLCEMQGIYHRRCDYVRWPASAYQIQSRHTEFKVVTPNSNSSHQIQILHTKFKFVTPNSKSSHQVQIRHTTFKFITPNSNSSHQIQIRHTKFKVVTPNSNSSHQIQTQYFHIRHNVKKSVAHN